MGQNNPPFLKLSNYVFCHNDSNTKAANNLRTLKAEAGDCDVKVMLHSKILSPNENNRNVPEAKINDVTFITEKFLVSHSKGQAG